MNMFVDLFKQILVTAAIQWLQFQIPRIERKLDKKRRKLQEKVHDG